MCLSLFFTMTADVSRIGDGVRIGAHNYQSSTNFNRCTKLDLTTADPIALNVCYMLLFFVLQYF